MSKSVIVRGPNGNVTFNNDAPYGLICGPCQIESRGHAFDHAAKIQEIAAKTGTPLIFKSSYDKANRSSLSTGRGVGMEEGLSILEEIRTKLSLPVLTDVHTQAHCAEVGAVVDVLQIPAFLCRQTDLLVAAAKTGKTLNIKKGQFLAPWDMENVAAKVSDSGNENILLCDRGTSFGYNTLVSDFRGLPIMARTGYPVVFDATHSVQQPGGQGTTSGGQREFAPVLARAAVSVGIAGLFIEAHETPDLAPSDGPNMLTFESLETLLEELSALDALSKKSSFRKV